MCHARINEITGDSPYGIVPKCEQDDLSKKKKTSKHDDALPHVFKFMKKDIVYIKILK